MENLIVESLGKTKEVITIPETAVVSRDKSGDMIFRIINQTDGDKRIVWNSRSIPEIRDAEKMFMDLIQKGFVPYRCDPNGKKLPVPMVQFDPMAEEVLMQEIVFIPQHMVVGG